MAHSTGAASGGRSSARGQSKLSLAGGRPAGELWSELANHWALCRAKAAAAAPLWPGQAAVELSWSEAELVCLPCARAAAVRALISHLRAERARDEHASPAGPERFIARAQVGPALALGFVGRPKMKMNGRYRVAKRAADRRQGAPSPAEFGLDDEDWE